MNEINVMDEDWAVLSSLLPQGWQDLARESQALKGLRKDKGAEALLRTLLLHLAGGYSLRETVVRAREAKLADLSDVALLKRLRKSKEWLHGLCQLLIQQQGLAASPSSAALRLVDATLIQEPGPTGSQWRIHYSLRWPQLICDHFALTGTEGRGSGESLTHFPVQAGEHLVADRGYSNYASVHHATRHGALVTVRLNPKAVRLLQPDGKPFALLRRLRSLKRANQVGVWEVDLSGAAGQPPVRGRLCALRKSTAAIAKARAKVERNANSNGRSLQADTLAYCEYVMIFTTAPESISACAALEIYRLRWQIELVFKRFKGLAQLGHLPKEDPDSAKAWLYGKLFAALLTQRLIDHAESFSPWGYDVAAKTSAQPLAGI